MSKNTQEFGTAAAGISPDSAFAPFRWPVFRTIWFANLASAMGSMIQMIAAAWLMTELTDSHLLVALVQASVTIPVLAFGLFAGVIADNYDRRKVMLAANAGMVFFSAVLTVLAVLDAIQPYSLLALTLIIGGGFALNGPAWQASVRLMVPSSDLPQAISLNTIAYNLARSLGPAIGGLVLAAWGPEYAFGVNALSYAVMVAVLMRWNARPTGRADKHPLFPAIGKAVAYVAASSALRRVLMRSLAFGFGSISFQALLPLVVKEQLRGDETAFGMLFGAFGVGSVVIAIWVARVRRKYGPEAIVTAAMAVSALAIVSLAYAPSVPFAMASCFAAGCGHVATLTSLNVSMQLRSPDEILGRCLSIFQATIFGGMALGAGAWGAVSDIFGLAQALTWSGLLLIAALIVLRAVAPMPKIGEGIPVSG